MEEKSEVTQVAVSQEQLQAVADWQSQMQNAAIMQQIVGEMKEIAVLPSEVPKDVHRLDRVEFPDKGGVLTYMDGYAHPYKGFPFFEFVDKIDMIKKVQRATLSSFYHSIKRAKWKLIFLPWVLSDLARAFVYTFYRTVERFRLKPLRYADAVRELHRAFSKEESDEMRHQLRDVACMLLEMDNAYRYRFQDIIVELDQAALRKRPFREVKRIMELLSERETTQEVKDTWRLVSYFLPFLLLVNPPFRKALVEVLGSLDLEKVALSIEDRFYCEKRLDYKFGFMKN